MTRRLSPPVVAAFGFALIAACVVVGCSNSTEPKHKESPALLPRKSPENVLFNLRAIYDGNGLYVVKTDADTLVWGNKYQELFHTDTFKFYFAAYDQPPDFPDGWWGLTDELLSFKNILRWEASGIIDDVKLTWTVNPSEPDSSLDDGDPPAFLHPTWRHIYVTGILLDVVVGIDTWRVPNASGDFYFAPDPADSTLWVITEWRDHSPGLGSPPRAHSAVASSSSTWGDIKLLFH